MYRKLTCLMALIIMLALSARVVVNLKHGLNDHKLKTEATGTNDGNDDKTEHDIYGESQPWLHNANTKNWAVIIPYQLNFFVNNFHFILPKHFCAVPTPPPWA